MGYLKDKTILLTGGTGSFGTAFTAIALKKYSPKVIRIFSRGEALQLDMMGKFNDDRLRFLIGDVRDRARVYRAMKDVDIVVHAAALKQVPTSEYNPIEAIRTNVDGSINIIDAALDCGVKKVVAISSDKACNPVNLYGATKLVMERLITQANVYGSTRFSCVRYGNVVGSRGSIIYLLPHMIKRKLITVTDIRMTRFWITLEQGVKFTIDSVDTMEGGEIFVPKIPSMSIAELIDAIVPKKTPIKVIGIRPGEKIHETLVTAEEARHTVELEDRFIIEPEYTLWGNRKGHLGRVLWDGFSYTSENNALKLTPTEMRKMVKCKSLN